MLASHRLTKYLNISHSEYVRDAARTHTKLWTCILEARQARETSRILQPSHRALRRPCHMRRTKGQRKPCAAFPTIQHCGLAAKGERRASSGMSNARHNMHHPAAFFYQKLLLRHARKICWVFEAIVEH